MPGVLQLDPPGFAVRSPKYQCPACERRQCLLHWRYPIRTPREADHFLKAAEAQSGKACFVRAVEKRRRDQVVTVWEIFTSEEDYQAYQQTGRHRG